MTDVTNWREKADQDLTAEDVAEMRRVGVPVDVTGPPPLPAHGAFVTATPTYVRQQAAPQPAFVICEPQLLTA